MWYTLQILTLAMNFVYAADGYNRWNAYPDLPPSTLNLPLSETAELPIGTGGSYLATGSTFLILSPELMHFNSAGKFERIPGQIHGEVQATPLEWNRTQKICLRASLSVDKLASLVANAKRTFSISQSAALQKGLTRLLAMYIFFDPLKLQTNGRNDEC